LFRFHAWALHRHLWVVHPAAIIDRDGLDEEFPHRGVGNNTGTEWRLNELELERRVNDYIRDLPFLWVDIDDKPGTASDRTYIE